MGHTRNSNALVVKLLIRPVTPSRAGVNSPEWTSHKKDTTKQQVSQQKSHTRNHRHQPSTNHHHTHSQQKSVRHRYVLTQRLGALSRAANHGTPPRHDG